MSFITSNKFARAGYGANLREFLLNKTTLLEFVDLNGLKVFEDAVVDTSIVSFIKDKASKTHKLNYANPSEKDLVALTYTQIPQSKLSKEAFIFGDDALFELKSKIESVGTPLKEWDIAIYRGVLTGYNEAFIIDTQTKEMILKACDDSDKSRKPIIASEGRGNPQNKNIDCHELTSSRNDKTPCHTDEFYHINLFFVIPTKSLSY